ncbi:putative vacuolar import/degradation protein Vid24 [Rosa chinensis]|uniref:Putative vacuolar import/degradation protein Vid24 n=1 Tax=Rosa chinensis TaxID=74649 RepID=A0A2P6R2B5_ROSCH|nr:putative vacuolar import/degradation protein Vid24 [Rosa chinensis]
MVITFWEGEIVDTKNYTSFTEKWEAIQVEVDGGKSLDLSNYPYIFLMEGAILCECWHRLWFDYSQLLLCVSHVVMAPSTASIMILIAARSRSLS